VLVIRDHVGRELEAIGGVDVILSASNSMQQNGEALHGLRDEGRFVTMAIGTEPIMVDPTLALTKQLVVKGSQMNGRRDLVEMLDLVAAGTVRPLLEVYPLEDVNTAFERLDRGRVRYRAVLRHGAGR
jgi:D-arabinose 1-dehydrogenase-like Zn-dependent alcohol dehydrogenase